MAKVEQTSNGSRVRLSKREWLTIAMFSIPILFGGVLFYANTNNGIEALAKSDEKHEEAIKEAASEVNTQQVIIVRLEERVIGVEKNIDKIQTSQQENQKLLYKVHELIAGLRSP